MRRAARTVALENSRLRSLLASRGVTREYVELYLALFNYQTPGDLLGVILMPQTIQADEPPAASNSELSHQLSSEEDDKPLCDLRAANITSTFQNETDMHCEMECGVGNLESDQYLSSDASTSALDKLSFLAHISGQQSCCGSTTQCSASDDQQQDTQTDTTTTNLLAEASCDSVLPPCGPIATTLSLEISCTAAAYIIANMHQFRNEEMVREDLGCLGPGECFISNITLFQLLDSLE